MGTFAGNAIGPRPAPLRATLLIFFSKYLFRTLFFSTRSQKGTFKRFPTKWYTLSLFESASVPWFFDLALQPHSTRAIALLSLWLAAPFLLSDKLLCHLHTCCLGSGCAMVLQFGLAASLN